MKNEELVLGKVKSEPLITKKQIYFGIKRFVDIFAGIIGLIPLFICTVFIKIAYMCTGDFHKIFFRQERIGKNGKTIKIFKFRSMVPNAEKVLEELMEKNPEIKKEYLKNKKLENDPRITKLGKIIRKLSIDELPQLLNVLVGDMSLVGPRPYLFREKKDMGKYYDYVIACKPGITGLWQVSGRSDTSFKQRLVYDKRYATERGLRFDIKILFKTVGVVLGKKGAK